MSTLELPIRAPEAAPAKLPMAEINGAGSPSTLVKPVKPDAEGRVRVDSSTPQTSYRVEAADVELTSSREEACEIVEGDPLSSKWSQTVMSDWRRGDWNCSVKASYALSCDSASFRLRESLHAVANGEDIIRISNETRIPRDLL